MSEVCPTCNGKKEIECTHCNDDEFKCTVCCEIDDALKQPVCEECDDRGYDCKICGNSGMMECDDCDGAGVI